MNRSEFLWARYAVDCEDIVGLARSCWPLSSQFFQNIDLGISEFLGRELRSVHAVYLPPNSHCPIHIDTRPDGVNQLALQIPIDGCASSVTRMWRSLREPEVRVNSLGYQYLSVDPSSCELIGEFCLDQPTFFRPDLPHSVHSGCQARRAISLRWREDPWDLVL